MQPLTYRRANPADLPELRALMAFAIDRLQNDFLTRAQVVASAILMGLDTQLIADSTYLVVESDGGIVGCGGWSRRATLYGGDHAGDLRDPRQLDPATEPARIRAMYTHPDATRRGVGRLILATCEAAAAAEGFASVELIATLAGEPLYRACGYAPIERTCAVAGGIEVPIVRMGKRLGSESQLEIGAGAATA